MKSLEVENCFIWETKLRISSQDTASQIALKTCSKEISGEWGRVYRSFATKIRWSDHQKIQFSSVTQSCPTLCNTMNRSTPGLPVHHQLPEFNQIHAHRVGDAIQPSHPLLSPSPPAPNPSQHQGLFQ